MPLWSFQTVTERQIVLDSIQLLLGFETTTFDQKKVLDGIQAKSFQIRRPIQVIHLSPKALQTMLEKFLDLSDISQKTQYLLNGLTAEPKLGTVIESLVFKTKEILARFTSQLSDLQLVCLFQSGQISKSQMVLENSAKLGYLIDQPLTLMHLYELIEADLFIKVQTVYDVLSSGIMDFLVAQKENQSPAQFKILQMQMFQDDSAIRENSNAQANENDKGISFTGELKELKASLDIEKIKPADRVAFLLNYLYLQLKNNQLAFTSFPESISLIREIFIASLNPYV